MIRSDLDGGLGLEGDLRVARSGGRSPKGKHRLFTIHDLRVHVPQGADDITVQAVRRVSWLTLVPASPVANEIAVWELGTGESSVLAWAREHAGSVALLDPFARPVLEKLVAVGMGKAASGRLPPSSGYWSAESRSHSGGGRGSSSDLTRPARQRYVFVRAHPARSRWSVLVSGRAARRGGLVCKLPNKPEAIALRRRPDDGLCAPVRPPTLV